MHPAIVAHAAATTAAMMPGRFVLGLGTGENLNEHVLGDPWPAPDERLDMLAEAIEVIRLLWEGGEQTHRGKHYTVDHARLYTLPDELPPIVVAAGAPKAAQLAGRRAAGGNGKPTYGMLHVCVAPSEEEGLETAHKLWANTALPGELSRELPRPVHFEDAVETVRREDVAESVPCGPGPDAQLDALQAFVDAGYDHVWVHQIGPDQEAFFRLYEREVVPALAGEGQRLVSSGAQPS
jgi:G6PDH family F420-dependent oxidoreductase